MPTSTIRPPLISICIPAYKRVDSLKRLLDSILTQTFKDFEVIVTDDSPSAEVADICEQYSKKINLQYFKNPNPLGTPENWNQAIRLAKGEWIKLMHDDDWFSSGNSLEAFQQAIQTNPGIDFFFSAYFTIDERDGKSKSIFVNRFRLHRLQETPAVLLARNIIGPPSVTIYKNIPDLYYDNRLKWLVDIDFYITYLTGKKSCYLDHALVNIGINEDQVTQSTFRVAEIEIPENFYLLNKIGIVQLKNITVFDAWWRLMRNLGITHLEDIRAAGYSGEIPPTIEKIIKFQRRIPRPILKNGFFSKTLMSICLLLGG